VSTPSLNGKECGDCQTRAAAQTDTSARFRAWDRFDVESLAESIARYYEDFVNYPDVRGPLATIRNVLAQNGSLQFSDRYPGRVIPLIQEIVAWEMYLCDYFPGQVDRIELGVIEALPMGSLNLMFATGLTDTSRISNPRVFVREDILRSYAGDTDPILKGFDTYAEEIRHSIEALWRNRIGYLTSSQQAMRNRGRLAFPIGWPLQGYCAGSFVPQILGESGSHLIDYVRYGHDRYGNGNDYNWDYFVDLVVPNGSVTLCQTDAHRPAQAVDRVVRRKLNLWTTAGNLLPTLARRIHQFFILSSPERKKPVSESTLRSWQELHDLPYVVGGLFDRGLAPSRFRSEVLRAGILTRKLHDNLVSDGLRIENGRVYQETLKSLDRVSKELASLRSGLDLEYVLAVKQSMWHLLRYAGKELNRGSALQAIVEEIDALEDLPSFYRALLAKIRDAHTSVLHTNPADSETRMLLHALFQGILSEAGQSGLPMDFHRSGFRAAGRNTIKGNAPVRRPFGNVEMQGA
jgi:hypothetical protein